MKQLLYFIFVLILVSEIAWGQELKVLTYSPDKPKIGDKILITYNAEAKNATLKDAKEIVLCACALQSNGLPGISETKMTRNGNLWQANYQLTDSLAKVVLFRFDTETATDDNNGNSWLTMVYNDKGEEVEKAHYTMGMLYSRGGSLGFAIPADKEKAKLENDTEKKLYPPKANSGNQSKLNQLYGTYQANKDKKDVVDEVVKDILKYIDENKNKESEISSAISLLKFMKQTEKADELTKAQIKLNPKGKVAEMDRQNKVFNEKDKAKQIEFAEKILRDVADLPQEEKDTYKSVIFTNLIALKKFDEAYKTAISLDKLSGSVFNSLAWPLIDAGEQLEKAVEWAKKGVELSRNFNPAEKSKYLTTKDWKKNKQSSLAAVLDTYAFGLFKLGKFEEAEKNYEEATTIDKSGLGEDANARYVECLNKNGKYEKALSYAEECIKINKTNDKLMNEYKTAYLKAKKGSEKDIDNIMAGLKAESMKKAQEQIVKELVNKPAPVFSLKSLDGKTVTLSDLKGKVVVVDFWATWCGPCKASFPALQKVYDKFKNNPNVIILAVNTWESESGKEREKSVAEFIKENKYTFPVLFDIDDRVKAFVTQFGVEGIPTKFVLDKEGYIQFKTVGFSDEKKMIDELEAQFELLLKDGHKALLKK